MQFRKVPQAFFFGWEKVSSSCLKEMEGLAPEIPGLNPAVGAQMFLFLGASYNLDCSEKTV